MTQEFESLAAEVDWERVSHDVWDALVIGAGPAGAMAAYRLAREGAAVLLVEKSVFPRPKVCGCCLNLSTLSSLDAADLGNLPVRLGARPLERVEIRMPSGSAVLKLPGGVALSRERFDAALVDEAIRAGATFASHTQASVGDINDGARTVRLRGNEGEVSARARYVLVADGLAGTSLARLPEFSTAVKRESHIGAGVILDGGESFGREGTIFMACGRAGYVGAVVLEDGRLNLAAALDRKITRGGSSIGELADGLLQGANLPSPLGITRQSWRGTPALTRTRRRIAGDRVLVLGDAAGYVEPFTGEGMAWALASANVVAHLVLQAAEHDRPDLASNWSRVYGKLIGRRQRVCRAVSTLLKKPWMARTALGLLAPLPWLAGPWVRSVNTAPAFSTL